MKLMDEDGMLGGLDSVWALNRKFLPDESSLRSTSVQIADLALHLIYLLAIYLAGEAEPKQQPYSFCFPSPTVMESSFSLAYFPPQNMFTTMLPAVAAAGPSRR